MPNLFFFLGYDIIYIYICVCETKWDRIHRTSNYNLDNLDVLDLHITYTYLYDVSILKYPFTKNCLPLKCALTLFVHHVLTVVLAQTSSRVKTVAVTLMTSSRGIAQLYISSMVTYLPVLQKFGSSGVHQKIFTEIHNLYISRISRLTMTIPIGSMVLVYMLTWLGYIDGIHVTIYSSTMDPMGYNDAGSPEGFSGWVFRASSENRRARAECSSKGCHSAPASPEATGTSWGATQLLVETSQKWNYIYNYMKYVEIGRTYVDICWNNLKYIYI